VNDTMSAPLVGRERERGLRLPEPGGGARLLLVSPEFPAPLDRGFRIRVHHLAAELARHRHRVVLLAAAPNEPRIRGSLDAAGVEVRTVPVHERRPSHLRRAVEMARGRSAGWLERRNLELRRAVERMVVEEQYDAVQVEIPELASVRLPHGTRLVIDAHNVWSELIARRIPYDRSFIRRMYRRLEHSSYRRAERAAWSRSARCLVTSGREADIVQANSGAVPTVIPNGVDTARYRPAGRVGATTPPCLVFTGLLAYVPNADAVAHLVRDIMPRIWHERPDVVLHVVGGGASASLTALAGERVTFAGWVADVRPFVSRADVVVVPLRMGSGTRFKILEAMAMARPIVTTTLGVEGIGATDGEHVVVADGAAAFAAAVLRVLGEPPLARSLGRSARRLVESNYAWRVIGDRLDHMYRDLLAEARS
jgi:glycosyltransferase involved in cell wall biosynthesis